MRILYVFAFLLPPLMFGTVRMFSAFSDVMLHNEPKPLAARTQAPAPAHPVKTEARPYRAVILVSGVGTQVTDLLASYQVLAESGKFSVTTASPEVRLAPLTAEISVLPDTALSNDLSGDLLVIPAMLNPGDPTLVNWVKKSQMRFKKVLVLGEGIRLALKAGVITSQNATTHFLAFKELTAAYPNVHWEAGARWVEDGRIITSAGMTASADATVAMVKAIAGDSVAFGTAKNLGLPPAARQESTRKLEAADFTRFFLHGGYVFGRPRVAVLVAPGINELELAAALDVLPRTLSVQVTTVAPERAEIRTRNGLKLIPQESMDTVWGIDHLLVLESEGQPLEQTRTASWLKESGAAVTDWRGKKSTDAYARSFQWLAELGVPDSGSLRRTVGKLIVRPENAAENTAADSGSTGLSLWLRPFAVGLLGIALGWMVELRLRRRRRN
jgi:transcriptional regulator GlxA family with amidase domain